ncbi:hypothetical protein [Natronorubrum daqingense]|uniref:DUF8152 domain-containing protein n=1 Tax=Natronorubrum daqingense TaxID=588898 RepID=A0A1N7DWM1_9EURY|nr:hypothetical protein [Natronorubrum daqingense]APX96216.1 hypothetical protein BB347_06020 [Natronorubrum daqingense]SIR80115.1 hypothetical protein SAMN05421809_2286 [Natronorubrum daqingense]
MTDDTTPQRVPDPDEPLEANLEYLHRHLAATAELPVDRDASRWLGEADAIARDVATTDLERSVVDERVGKIETLLAEVDETGHEEADEHLEAARQICVTVQNSDFDA